MKLLKLAVLAILMSGFGMAQFGTLGPIKSGTALPSKCRPSSSSPSPLFFLFVAGGSPTGALYQCAAVDTWTIFSAGGAGTGTVTNIATNNGLTGGPITTTGTIGLVAIANNAALCNNSGSSAVPTTANCTVTGTGNLVLAVGPTFITPVLGTPASGNASNLTNIPLTLTTTGSSGAATYTQSTSTLNIPQYSGSCPTCVTSAAALTANLLLIGGGLQASATTATGTGVLTALGVNVGSAGAFLVNGGALGNPSSGTLTNASGLPIAGITGLGTGVGTALAASVSGTGGICLASGSACAASTTITTGTTATLSTAFTVNQEATAAAGVTYTLPTASSGAQYCVDNGYNGSAATSGVLTLATSAAGQFIVWTDGSLSATGGNVTSGGAARDGACVYGIDSTHWMFLPHSQSGTAWTKH